jgi:hypothetical protein
MSPCHFCKAGISTQPHLSSRKNKPASLLCDMCCSSLFLDRAPPSIRFQMWCCVVCVCVCVWSSLLLTKHLGNNRTLRSVPSGRWQTYYIPYFCLYPFSSLCWACLYTCFVFAPVIASNLRPRCVCLSTHCQHRHIGSTPNDCALFYR